MDSSRSSPRAAPDVRGLFLPDPVTVKEVFGISRRGQTYVARGVYVILLGLILAEFWSTTVSRLPVLTPSLYAQVGHDLFVRFVPLQMAMVTLAALGASADRVIREERSGTLGLLLLTPLSAGQVALSKWKAAGAQAGSLLLCGVPVLAVCSYLGGLTPGSLLWCFALTLSMALLGAAFGLRASAVATTVPRALLLGLGYLIGYTLLPLTFIFFAGGAAVLALPFLHPVYSLLTLMISRSPGPPLVEAVWIPSTLVSVVVARAVVRSTAVLIERKVRVPLARAPVDGAGVPSAVPARRSRTVPSPGGFRDVWESRPLLWKEMVTRAGGRWSREARSMFLLYASLFIALCWLFSRGASLGTFAFLGAGFIFLAVVNGAALFAPEKEGRKMEMLLSAPVPSASIVWSKLVAGLVSPESLRIQGLALCTTVAFSWWSGSGVLVYLGVAVLYLAFVFALAACCSLHSGSLQGAALAAAGILCVLLLVAPLVAELVDGPAAAPGPSGPAAALLRCLNPVWVLEAVGAEGSSGAGAAGGRFLLFAAVHLGATGALVAALHARFDRRMGRA